MQKKILLVIVIGLVVFSIYRLESGKVRSVSSGSSGAGGVVPEITAPAGFINAEPFALADLLGKKVIMVDFWTYSCINCQRTLPYLNAWYEKYRDSGLEIVGIHTPEFEFEKLLGNVQTAVDKYKIQYPVVLDNDYGTWSAYKNRYWPRKYLIDINGKIVYDHIGEGAYAETEEKIQELLAQRAKVLGEQAAFSAGIVQPQGVSASGRVGVQSPEVYFGSHRNEFLINGARGVEGVQSFTLAHQPKLNQLALIGEWKITPEYASTKQVGAKIVFRYRAQDVYFVSGSAQGARVRIMYDGETVQAEAGEDVRDGVVFLNENRLYKLIEDDVAGEHLLEIELLEGELEAFTFTFG